MNKLGQIAIALFVVNNTAFDLINISNSTKLNVTFFSVMYLCLMLFCIQDFITSNRDYLKVLMGIGTFKDMLYFVKNNKIKSFSLVMGIAFAVRIISELTKWNLDWDSYLISVSDFDKSVLFSFLTIALILIPITNERGKRNNRNDNT